MPFAAPPSPSEQDAFVRRELAKRFLAEQLIAELSHLPVGMVAVALAWGTIGHEWLIGWWLLLAGATVVRRGTRRRVERRDALDGIPGSLRAAIVAIAVVWGGGVLAAAMAIPPLHVAFLIIIICGLTAAATSTLLGDWRTYAAYTATMLVLTAFGVLELARTNEFAFALLLVVLYGLVMVALYRRLFRIVLKALITEYELEKNRGLADRERAFLDQLFASAPNTLIVVDGERRVRRTNPAFEQMFGYTAAEVLGQPLDELIVGPDQRAASRDLRSAVMLGTIVRADLPRRRKDGTEITVRVSAARISADTEDLLIIYDDISEMKRSEEALRQSEARLFQTLASLPVGIMVLEPDGKPYFVNDAAVRLLGRKMASDAAPDTLANTYQVYVAGTSTPYPVDRMPVIRALHGETSTIDDMEIRRPNGPVVVEVFGSPILDQTGAVMFGVAAFTDITERRRVAETISAARTAAEEATAAKSAFLANMSHEIRTPLNGILGMAELLLDGGLSPADERSVGMIITSGETLLHVINDILDFSKIEAHQLDIEQTNVDLASVVESTARLLMPKATAGGIEVITEIGDDIPPHVLGDPTRLRQVLTNLVGNAVKFTDRGEVVVKLETVGPADGATELTRFQFTVRDTGPGIPAEKLGTIFEAFRQADATTTRRYGGTGLGLSISKRLVELMGGTIAVESTIGVGSVFRFDVDLPIVDSQDVVSSLPSSLHGIRVLVVDDNGTNRRVMCEMLARAGCQVDDAENGTEGLRAAHRAHTDGQPYQLIMTDLVMPEFDGFDLVQALRGDPALGDTPVVMATSVSRRGDSQRCRDLGVGAYLLKPVARGELIHAVSTTLGVAASGAPRGTPGHGVEAIRRAIRILLAEDNPVNQEVASAMLRRRGHLVDIVETGRAAVAAESANNYDVILMDVQMPDLDGIAATQEIRRRFGTVRPRIIALTANAMNGERERCLAAGMDDYISKPFKSIELFAAVEGGESRSEHGGSSSIAETDSPVDLAGLRDDLRAGGVEEIFDNIIGMFVLDGPRRMDALRAAVAERDPRSIERAAHAFKSAAGTIRAQQLTELLQQMEQAGREGATDDTDSRFATIETAYSAVHAQLASLSENGSE